MKNESRDTFTLAAILTILIAAGLIGFAMSACRPEEQIPYPITGDPVSGPEGQAPASAEQSQAPAPTPNMDMADTTHFTNLYIDDDLDIADDLTVADDVSISDDLTVSGDLTIGDGTPGMTLAGEEDMYIEGDVEIDGTVGLHGYVEHLDNVVIDGSAADEIQLRVQGYTTQTNHIFVVEPSGGTDLFWITNDGDVEMNGTTPLLTVGDAGEEDTTILFDGNAQDFYVALDDSADDLVLGLGSAVGTTPILGLDENQAVTFTGSAIQAINVENVGAFPTIATASVITTTTDGALWTIADGEIWFVEALYCLTTESFACTGDDCTLIIGDGNDTDGFLVLTDAEMQLTDAEFTGAPANWHGLHTDTLGAYLAGLATFVYAPSGAAETIDVDVGGTDVAAGAATCYLVYTRVQ